MLTTEQLRKKTKRDAWERRFQSVMITLVAGAIVWGVQTLVSVDKNQAIAATRLERLEVLQAGAYSARDAKRDVAEMTRRIDKNEQSIIGLDGRLKIIEGRNRRGDEP